MVVRISLVMSGLSGFDGCGVVGCWSYDGEEGSPCEGDDLLGDGDGDGGPRRLRDGKDEEVTKAIRMPRPA